MKSFAVLMFSVLSLGSVAQATLQPLPGQAGSPYVGNSIPVNVGWWVPSSQDLNGGGAFNAFVTPAGQNSINTAFWCVDDQTYFYPIENGLANITRLTTPFPAANGATPNTVSFQDVGSNTTTEAWHNTAAPNGNALSSDPRDRLLMAAYLIENYGGYGPTFTTITGTPPANPATTNLEIQQAIWAITNNAEFQGSHTPGSGYDGDSTCGIANCYNTASAGVKYWINEAQAHYADTNLVDPNAWAVVSWNADANGNLTSTSRQTFLVRLDTITIFSPEPGFYGVLTLGLIGLGTMLRKRKAS